MKKLLTLALTLAVLAVLTGLSVGQGAQQKDKQKRPPAGIETKQPAPTKAPVPQDATTVKGSKSNSDNRVAAHTKMMTGKVTKVNEKDKTFTVTANGKQFTFDGKTLKAPPKVGEIIDITYTQTPGGPMEATTINTTRSNTFRIAGDDEGAPSEQKRLPTGVETKQPATAEKKLDKASPQSMKVKVLEVNGSAKTLTVMVKGKAVTFNAANLKSLPKVGDTINMGGDDPTGQRVVCAVVECDMGWGSGYCIKCFDYQPLRMTGKVMRVNEKDKTFTIMTKGKEVNFSAKTLKALPEVGKIIDITYTQTTPGGPMEVINLNSSKSNVY